MPRSTRATKSHHLNAACLHLSWVTTCSVNCTTEMQGARLVDWKRPVARIPMCGAVKSRKDIPSFWSWPQPSRWNPFLTFSFQASMAPITVSPQRFRSRVQLEATQLERRFDNADSPKYTSSKCLTRGVTCRITNI
jgi:hypothetical protein